MNSDLLEILKENGVELDDSFDETEMNSQLIEETQVPQFQQVPQQSSSSTASSVSTMKIKNDSNENQVNNSMQNAIPKPTQDKRTYKVDLSRIPTAVATLMAYELDLEDRLEEIKDYLKQDRFKCVFQKRMDKELTEDYKQACIGLGIPVKTSIAVNHDAEPCKAIVGKGSDARRCVKPGKAEYQGYCGLHKNQIPGASKISSVTGSSSTTHQCSSYTKNGKPCGKNIQLDETYCVLHKNSPILEPIQKNTTRCRGFSKDNRPCNKFPLKGSVYCQQHYSPSPSELNELHEKSISSGSISGNANELTGTELIDSMLKSMNV